MPFRRVTTITDMAMQDMIVYHIILAKHIIVWKPQRKNVSLTVAPKNNEVEKFNKIVIKEHRFESLQNSTMISLPI